MKLNCHIPQAYFKSNAICSQWGPKFPCLWTILFAPNFIISMTKEEKSKELYLIQSPPTWQHTGLDSPDYMNNHLNSWLAWQAALRWKSNCSEPAEENIYGCGAELNFQGIKLN